MVEVFGTIGPACNDIRILQEMFRAGMTGMRLNLSHTMLKDSCNQISDIKKAAAAVGITPKLLIDLQGPELRIGNLTKDIELVEGDVLMLSDGTTMTEDGIESGMTITEQQAHNDITEQQVHNNIIEQYNCNVINGQRICNIAKGTVYIETSIMNAIEKGDEILFDDGKIKASVTEKTQNAAKLHLLRGGTLKSRKSILIKDKDIRLPTLTKNDLLNIKDAASLNITGVMLPFVRNKEDIITLRRALEEADAGNIEIYAKIENLEGVRMLDDLIAECDEIVIARGDLGNAVPLWELPGLQKNIADRCRHHNRRFMVVTQMLSSMEHSQVPTRAEVSDIYNAVLDGATSVMVTGETAIGEYPVDVIRYLCKTAKEAEKNM